MEAFWGKASPEGGSPDQAPYATGMDACEGSYPHHPQGMPSVPRSLVLSGPCTALSAKAAWASVLPGSQPLSDTDVCPQVL